MLTYTLVYGMAVVLDGVYVHTRPPVLAAAAQHSSWVGMLALLAATATAPTAAAAAPSFSPPLLVSAPVQCYDGAQKKLCGYLQVRDGSPALH